MASRLLTQDVMDDSCRWPTKPFLDFSVAPKSQFGSEIQRADDGFPWFSSTVSSSIWRQNYVFQNPPGLCWAEVRSVHAFQGVFAAE